MGELKRLWPYIPRIAFALGALIFVLIMADVIPISSNRKPAPPQSGPTPTAALGKATATPTATPVPSPAATPQANLTPKPVAASLDTSSVAAEEGLFLLAEVSTNAPGNEFEVGFYGTSEDVELTRLHALRFRDGVVYAVDGDARSESLGPGIEGVTRVGSIQPGTDYRVLMQLLSHELGGAVYYLSGGQYGAIGETWSLAWRSEFVAEGQVKALAIVPDAGASARILASEIAPGSRPAVQDLFATDAESRSPLRGRIPAISAATDGWDSPEMENAWVIREGAAMSLDSRQLAVIESGVADGLVSASIAPWTLSGLVVRYSDPDNWIGIRRQGADNSLMVVRRENGDSIKVADAPVPEDIGEDARLDVFLRGEEIRVYADGAEVLKTSEPFNQSATRHGLWSFGEMNRFQDFAVWPATPAFSPR